MLALTLLRKNYNTLHICNEKIELLQSFTHI